MKSAASKPKIVFVGEAWGEFEEIGRRPFVGVSGHELFRQLCEAEILSETAEDHENRREFWRYWRFWADSGRPRNLIRTAPLARIWDAHPEIHLTNVFNLRPQSNNIETLCAPSAKEGAPGLPPLKAGKYLLPDYVSHLDRLQDELASIRPHLTVALGGVASWALLGDPRITKLRGAVAHAQRPFQGKVLPVYHPAHVARSDGYKNRPVTIIDLIKARREATFPDVRRPVRTILVPESIGDLYEIRSLESLRGLSPDIETAGAQITCVGFGFSESLAAVIPFIDPRRDGASYWRTLDEERVAWDTCRRLAARPGRKIFQNCLFDINRLWRRYGLTFAGEIEDTMLKHHAQQPESPKDLGFLGSIYTNEPAWKLMRARGQDNFKKDE